MRKCPSCKSYTLLQDCPKCSVRALSPHPAKFSPLDKYGKYRRMMIKQALSADEKNKEKEKPNDNLEQN